MPKIEMGKQYKSSSPDGLFDGRKFRRVISIDCAGDFPVVVEISTGMLITFTSDGRYRNGTTNPYDLIEVTPFSDFKRGDPVMVSNNETFWNPCHFSHELDGKVFCFVNGESLWSTNNYTVEAWKHCRRPTPEELKERGM